MLSTAPVDGAPRRRNGAGSGPPARASGGHADRKLRDHPEGQATRRGYHESRFSTATQGIDMATANSLTSQTPFESAQPRYLAVAERLSKSINQGEYGVGSLLPTESELCDKFGVSRHTVREALRKLRDLGLVTRHQGVGTRVENAEISGRYVASLNSIQDMWRHVEKTQAKVVFKSVEKKEQALFPLPAFAGDETWQRVDVLRSNMFDKKLLPVSLSHLYINNVFKGIVGMIDAATVPIFALIEKKYGQKVVLVHQEIAAMMIDSPTAKLLKTKPNSPGLSIIRVYMGPGDVVIQASQAISPADRFTYEMDLHLELGR